jgi:hypothetical protein
MKFLKYPVLFALCLVVAVSASSCKDDDEAPAITCDAATTDYIQKAFDYESTANPTKASCEAYKASYQQLLKSCGSTLTAQQKAEAEAEINALVCN